jgi:hypothetical protein
MNQVVVAEFMRWDLKMNKTGLVTMLFGETKEEVLVTGPSNFFEQLKPGELVKLNGFNLKDKSDQRGFRATGCEKIYPEKVIDVLGI